MSKFHPAREGHVALRSEVKDRIVRIYGHRAQARLHGEKPQKHLRRSHARDNAQQYREQREEELAQATGRLTWIHNTASEADISAQDCALSDKPDCTESGMSGHPPAASRLYRQMTAPGVARRDIVTLRTRPMHDPEGLWKVSAHSPLRPRSAGPAPVTATAPSRTRPQAD